MEKDMGRVMVCLYTTQWNTGWASKRILWLLKLETVILSEIRKAQGDKHCVRLDGVERIRAENGGSEEQNRGCGGEEVRAKTKALTKLEGQIRGSAVHHGDCT